MLTVPANFEAHYIWLWHTYICVTDYSPLCTNMPHLLHCANLWSSQSISSCLCLSVYLWLHLTLPSSYHTDLLCQLSDAAAAAVFLLTSTFFVATFQKLISILTNQETNTFRRLLYHYYCIIITKAPAHFHLTSLLSEGQAGEVCQPSKQAVLLLSRSTGQRRTVM